MAFDARVFQILIASPGDVPDERRIISEVIHDWNYLNATEKSIVLLPLRYETHATLELNEPTQDRINWQVVDHCDMAVGVFWTRLGTPTGRAESGTAEEIQRVGDAGKPVMLYFSRAKVDLEEVDLGEYARLKEFKQRTYTQGLVDGYATTDEFRDKFARHLALKVRELVARDADDENRDTDLRQHTGLQLRLAEGDPLVPLAENAVVEVEQVTCPDFQHVPDDHFELVHERVTKHSHRPFRLALINDDGEGLQHLHLDIVVTADHDDDQLLVANSSNSPASSPAREQNTSIQAGSISVVNIYEPSRDYFVLVRREGGDSWTMELDLPVVHAGRTVSSRNEFWLDVTRSRTVVLDCTAYSSSSAPFTMRTAVEIRLTQRTMSWQEIVAEAQAG
ncbi:hypothetical protein BBK82_19570 [Lentzea guizhouensis]|uniref:DUF4062 domain-containing protein n=1 Tax=Lentzea guizhouensis TaxID=1586287 RepID=A0A1B2HJL6_9PSEU|nr:hypothetical protein [Lentzea guizhouensis]ANZ37928.1 hypothetical protein BBK82_19570 [Lentzea guizhouensis]